MSEKSAAQSLQEDEAETFKDFHEGDDDWVRRRLESNLVKPSVYIFYY